MPTPKLQHIHQLPISGLDYFHMVDLIKEDLIDELDDYLEGREMMVVADLIELLDIIDW